MPLDETIFLTGFPGFIASRLVKQLAIKGARFLLLVQPAFTERARHEATHIAEETGVAPGNFRILGGDITATELGLSTPDLEAAREETTALFHLAAIYDLAVGRDLGVRVNVERTRTVNHLALQMKNLHRYHYVSTCYVAGKRKGLIYETELRHE